MAAMNFALFLFSLLLCLSLSPHPLLAAPTTSSFPPIPVTKRQAPPNTVATRFPTFETVSLNLTFSILPAPLALAQQIAGNDYPLLSSFREYLPADIGATIKKGQHPLFVIGYYGADVHYAKVPFGIPALSSAQTFVGFVDCTGDGKTACYRQWSGYFDQLGPVVAGNIMSASRLFAGSFDSPHSPYAPIGSGRYGLNASDGTRGLVGADRPFTSSFAFTTSPSGLNGKVAQRLLDVPIVRSYDSRCFKSIYFFNETTTPIRSIVGDIDVRSPLLPSKGSAKQRLSGKGVQGVTAAVQRAITIHGVNCSIYANAT